jgi:hypothetical protein
VSSKIGSREGLLLAVAAGGFAACVIANWPGHFPPDAIDQLAQGRAGVFNFWHPPVMAWLLGMADRILPGAPLFFVADAALFFAALAALALVRGGSWTAAALAGAICASPLALIYQGLVVKDVLFADAALAGFAAIAWAARLWDRRTARRILVALALGLLTLAALARQNGAIVAVIGALTLAVVDRTRAPRADWLRFASVAGAAVAAMGLSGGLAEAGFRAHSDHQPEIARQWMTLQVYDLAGAVRHDPQWPLAVLHRSAPGIEAFVRDDAAPAYDPTRIDPMYRTGRWNAVLKTPDPIVGAQWKALIFGAPGLYLAQRWAVFRQVFLTPDIQACAAVLVGVDPGHPDWLLKAGLTASDTDKDDWDGDYASAFLGTPVFAHATYALIAVILLGLAVRDIARRTHPELIVTIGLLLGALAYAASFALISIACDYRYLYFLDVAAMAALVQRAALGFGPKASRAAATLSNT